MLEADGYFYNDGEPQLPSYFSFILFDDQILLLYSFGSISTFCCFYQRVPDNGDDDK